MEIRNLCSSTSSTKIIQLGRGTNLDRPLRVTTTSTRSSSSHSRWRSLWRKLMREKRKIRIFDCSAAHNAQVHVPGYDPYTYAQNFDQGLMWSDEPDSLARSFSMRFAAPSRLITTGFLDRTIISDVAQDKDVICVVF